MRVFVCAVSVLSRGPGGDVSAAQAALPESSAGFHTRLTSSYEDKAISSQICWEAAAATGAAELTNKGGAHTDTQSPCFASGELLRPTHTNYYVIRLRCFPKHVLSPFHFFPGAFTAFKSTLTDFSPVCLLLLSTLQCKKHITKPYCVGFNTLKIF